MKTLENYIKGWKASEASAHVDVMDPAKGEMLARTPLSTPAEVDAAVRAAAEAMPAWRRVPALDRIQYLFKMKAVLEENIEQISRTITLECGKTLDESRGEMRRAIENVEVACGIPMMMKGEIAEDIAPGIDEIMLRQPVGVSAIIAPFNFPGMITFWFLPYALACGNTCLVKPSEKAPLTMDLVFRLIEAIGLPEGTLNLVHGGSEVVNAILDHPDVKAVSFVGSTPVARHIYQRAAQNGKRVQAQGGAKNPLIVLPDADMDSAVRIAADSAFGCAGQRCLATSLAVTVGDAGEFVEGICEAAATRRVGHGLDPEVQMGPVITPASRERIEALIQAGVGEGAQAAVDGRAGGHPHDTRPHPQTPRRNDPGLLLQAGLVVQGRVRPYRIVIQAPLLLGASGVGESRRLDRRGDRAGSYRLATDPRRVHGVPADTRLRSPATRTQRHAGREGAGCAG